MFDPLDDPKRILQAFDFGAELAARDQQHEAQMRELLLSLITVMDSFDRFLSAVEDIDEPTADQALSWLSSVRSVARQLESILKESGVTPMACLGQSVQPQRHEIVEVEQTELAEDDVIIDVIRRGYDWQGQLLRRAQVAVAENRREGI